MAAIPSVGQRITSLSSATALTVPGAAQKAVVSCTEANLRYYVDGRTPTSTAGHQLYIGSAFVIGKSELTTVRFIEESANGVLEVTYYDNLDDLTEMDQR